MIEANIYTRHTSKYGSFFIVEMLHNQFRHEFMFNCGDVSAQIAELKAIEYFVKSITSECYNHELVINLGAGLFSKVMLTRSGSTWAKEPSRNAELITEVRTYLSYFPDFTINVLRKLPALQVRLDNFILSKEDK